jgi:hypothetical protein
MQFPCSAAVEESHVMHADIFPLQDIVGNNIPVVSEILMTLLNLWFPFEDRLSGEWSQLL